MKVEAIVAIVKPVRPNGKRGEIGTNIMDIININALDTEKAIPLCKSANFRLPTIRTAIED